MATVKIRTTEADLGIVLEEGTVEEGGHLLTVSAEWIPDGAIETTYSCSCGFETAERDVLSDDPEGEPGYTARFDEAHGRLIGKFRGVSIPHSEADFGEECVYRNI